MLDRQQVEDARLRLQEDTGQREDFGPSTICRALRYAIPLLEELRGDLIEAGKGATWLPGWLIGGLVATLVDGLLAALSSWREDTCT